MHELKTFLRSNPDPRELIRAIAVEMSLNGHTDEEINDALGVSSEFVGKWKQRYLEVGVSGLKLPCIGAGGYLTAKEKAAVLTWLLSQPPLTAQVLKSHIEKQYRVVFQSKQMYYDLLGEVAWLRKRQNDLKKKFPPSYRPYCAVAQTNVASTAHTLT